MRVVIVGSSVGSVRAAQALRSEGFDGRVLLVGGERRLPYDKPPLSKQFLAGERDADGVTLLGEAEAGQDGIELRLGTAARRLDVAGRQVLQVDGTVVEYDALIVTTGASARPSPWRPDSGVHVVRTLDDSVALRDDLGADGPVIVVGGGFIGAEVAATARGLGREVVVVDLLPTPIGPVVGPKIGRLFTESTTGTG